jgi:hypothetical protein
LRPRASPIFGHIPFLFRLALLPTCPELSLRPGLRLIRVPRLRLCFSFINSHEGFPAPCRVHGSVSRKWAGCAPCRVRDWSTHALRTGSWRHGKGAQRSSSKYARRRGGGGGTVVEVGCFIGLSSALTVLPHPPEFTPGLLKSLGSVPNVSVEDVGRSVARRLWMVGGGCLKGCLGLGGVWTFCFTKRVSGGGPSPLGVLPPPCHPLASTPFVMSLPIAPDYNPR